MLGTTKKKDAWNATRLDMPQRSKASIVDSLLSLRMNITYSLAILINRNYFHITFTSHLMLARVELTVVQLKVL